MVPPMAPKKPAPAAKAAFNMTAFRDEFMDLIRAERFDDADELVEQTVADSPENAALRYEAGFNFSKKAKRLSGIRSLAPQVEHLRVKAFEHFRKASDLEPNKYPYAFRAGMTGRQIARREALTYLTRAIALDQSSAHPWVELGMYHQNANRASVAVACFENALRLDHNDELAQRMLYSMTQATTAAGPIDWKPLAYKA